MKETNEPTAAENLTRHEGRVTSQDRNRLLGQRGCVVWLTGLSGSGKSTLAYALEERLIRDGHLAFVLDGDNVRHGLNADLGFSPGDRVENIRRLGHLASLMADAGLITLTAFISPYRSDRQRARRAVGERRFLEVHLNVSVEVCEGRDPKGLYRRARTGEIPEFTGVSAPYEEPHRPEVRLDSGTRCVEDCVEDLLALLRQRGFLLDRAAPPAS